MARPPSLLSKVAGSLAGRAIDAGLRRAANPAARATKSGGISTCTTRRAIMPAATQAASVEVRAPVDVEHLAGHVVGLGRGQDQRRGADVARAPGAPDRRGRRRPLDQLL